MTDSYRVGDRVRFVTHKQNPEPHDFAAAPEGCVVHVRANGSLYVIPFRDIGQPCFVQPAQVELINYKEGKNVWA